MFENVDGRTDDGVTGKLLAHPWAFGSGELSTRSEIKVTVTRKWYATLIHPKMHPQTKFGIPTSKNIGDMYRTRSWMDGRTDGQSDYYMPPKSPFGGYKNKEKYQKKILNKLISSPYYQCCIVLYQWYKTSTFIQLSYMNIIPFAYSWKYTKLLFFKKKWGTIM